MTAVRVVDSHFDLDDVGQLTHDQLDTYLTGSAFLVVSGTGPLPPAARRLKPGAGITIDDAGPGGDLIISTTRSTSLSGSLISWMEVPSGPVNGVNVSYNVSNIPLPSSSLMLFVNGMLQTQGPSADYVLSGTLINLVVPPRNDSNILATYPYSNSTGFSWMEVPSGVVDGANVTFTLQNIPVTGTLMLYVNGILLKPGSSNDYTLSGTTIVLLFAPQVGSNIAASYPF